MAFSMNLWKVEGNDLTEINTAVLDKEERLENWITKDPSILGIDLLLIGRQVTSEYRGRIEEQRDAQEQRDAHEIMRFYIQIIKSCVKPKGPSFLPVLYVA